MSFADRLVLWLHIGFAIFTIGPVALAISSTPRYIRRRELPILRYLSRITMIFTIGSLLVLVAGIVLGQLDHDFAHPWLTVAMTLFIVAIVLLVLIIRDQRRAIRALDPRQRTQRRPRQHTPDRLRLAASPAGQLPVRTPDRPRQRKNRPLRPGRPLAGLRWPSTSRQWSAAGSRRWVAS